MSVGNGNEELDDLQQVAERNEEGKRGLDRKIVVEHDTGVVFLAMENKESEQREMFLKKHKLFRGRVVEEEGSKERFKEIDGSMKVTGEESSEEGLDDGAQEDLDTTEDDEDQQLSYEEMERIADADRYEEMGEESDETEAEEESQNNDRVSKVARDSGQNTEEAGDATKKHTGKKDTEGVEKRQMSNKTLFNSQGHIKALQPYVSVDVVDNRLQNEQIKGDNSKLEEKDADTYKLTYRFKKLERLGHIKTLPRRELVNEHMETFQQLRPDVVYQSPIMTEVGEGGGSEDEGIVKRNFFWEHVLGIKKAFLENGRRLHPKAPTRRHPDLSIKERNSGSGKGASSKPIGSVEDIHALKRRTSTGFSLFTASNTHERAFSTDDEPVDEGIVNRLESLVDIEDAIFAGDSDKTSSKKIAESLIKDTSRKASTYPFNVLNNPLLQDPDSIDPLVGLTRSDRAILKALRKASSEGEPLFAK
ncbi:hypothetical protein O6H91_02G050200 [Diphasiastrum complanatum]|nr:hypothetical protein O6H91_02G050200 [Diphasiastrum complanatum]